MKPERWQEIERLCQTALEMEPGKREAYLKEACAGDEPLQIEVAALLANQPEAEGFMKDPAMEAAAKVLAKEQGNALARDLTGRTIAHYRIVEKIGKGGMGEVFLAEDTSLHRKVALKFLPPETQRDAAAHKRFIREAHSAAALDHPYICHINEVGESDGRNFIVMEYVDGQTLRDRLSKGPLPLKEAIQIASEISEALEEAHEKKIIHRDLKPANVMLTRRGHAKVMDFGLAKQLIPPVGIEGQEESVTSLTCSGMTPGTPAYMSPEQLRGETIDVRSDIFSFGVVLYEMLAGVHPFKRETGMDTGSAILKDAPQPLGELRPDAPDLLQHIVEKVLAKDPHYRYQAIHDVLIDLRELPEESNGPAPGKRRRLKTPYWIAAAAVAIVGAGIWTFSRFFPREVALPPPRIVPVTRSGSEKALPALSPDGNWVAFQWQGEKRDNWDIYVKEVDGPGFNRLTTDPADDCCATWSPDGRQIAFLRSSGDRSTLYLISPLGGGERKVSEVSLSARLSWSPDGKNIAYADRKSPGDPSSIWFLSMETLEKKQMTAPEESYYGDIWPAFSPDGRYLAFVRRRSDFGEFALYVMDLIGGEPRLVTDHNRPFLPCWTADSREIVFTNEMDAAESALFRIFVNGGEPRRVLARGVDVCQSSISRNRLAYISATSNFDLWTRELNGDKEMTAPSTPLLPWSSSESDTRISPDGSRIAFASDSSGSSEIWVCNADGAKPMKLTDMNRGWCASPDWSPDGKWIAFDSIKSGSIDIYMVSVEAGRVRQITSDPADEAAPCWSRDGHWIYFGSNKSGAWQIWRMPSDGGNAVQITKDGGNVARESADGQFLYYCRQKGGIWRVPVSGGQETIVLDIEISPHLWDLTERGIYLIDGNAKPVATICFYDFATRRVRTLAPAHSDPRFEYSDGFSVSPDETWLLYSGGIYTADIMMIDNFR